MRGDVRDRLETLPQMTRPELLALWHELFRSKPPSHLQRPLLISFLAYKIQEQEYGGLKPATSRRLREIARKLQADPRSTVVPTPHIKAGTRLVREWKGRTLHVTVLDDVYEYAGKRYSSLSEIARLITGTRWSGPLFFGLKRNRGADGTNGK